MKIDKLLVLDDDAISNYLSGEILSDFKEIKHYVIFDNGFDVLNYLSKCSTTEFPDLILVDLKMPEMDGFEFLRSYESKFKDKETSIVILTNSSLGKDKDRVGEFKAVKDFIRKPLTEEDLKELISRLEKNLSYS